ncbi:DNA-directed RNA polymerase subunit beta' [Rhizoctonia solani]|uniref:DNA-directed RNA polymerase subunit beta n=1 Tax=Rhizoctonia solani TaxID=456999 RepID=A0A8H8P017_9AGAM|nr:DNA-directed RNA polymerase subunit beta' [Rhizoctonia solani]QRW23044.1 DNA-directed RNA polymerase subunit beta' [Rhizoctonia solani]
MQKVFIGIMYGLVPNCVLKTVLAVIDFIYYAWLPIHTTTTLQLLDNALARFHQFKDVFVDLEIRKDFNINKIHSMVHYLELIWQMGAADGYNTETPKQLHIKFAKRAYKATNRCDFFAQMTVYLKRRERVAKFDLYLCWASPKYAKSLPTKQDVHKDPAAPGWQLAQTSPTPPVSISILPRVYGIQDFQYYMDKFFEDHNIPLVFSPNDKLMVFPKATQIIDDAFATGLVDYVHASPLLSASGSHGSFDMVLI